MRLVPLFLLLAVGCKPEEPDRTGPERDLPAPPWPDWAFDHWVWEDESTQESALALVDGYLERDIPVGAIIIDSPWATGYSTFEWDPALFPDPQGMVDELHAKGVRVIVWTVPGMNIDNQPLYDEGAANRWYMEASATAGEPAVVDWWKGDGSLIDYWNPEAVDWWHGLVDHTLDLGIDGWKCDGLDFAALLAPWSPGAEARRERLEYSHAYYRDFHDYTRARLGDDRLITARPNDTYGADLGGDATAFAPRDINWAAWVGDQDATFEGIQAALVNFYHSAEYGYVAFGSDIGGYREDSAFPETGRSKEVFVRWAQLGALSPVMENGGGGAHEPWRFDEETVDLYADAVALHQALLPYLHREGGVAFADERSLLTFLDKEDFRYLLGPDVFVAPMIEPGTSRDVVFPDDGRWIWLYDPSVVHEPGSAATLTVPLDRFPAFVREGSEVADELAAWMDAPYSP